MNEEAEIESVDELARAVQDLRDELRRLRDCEEIRQVMYAYARGVDRADQDLLAPTFHDNVYDDHGNFQGDKASTLAALKRSSEVRETTASSHFLGNILIDLRGEEADVETYFMAYQRREENGKTYTRTRAGRYLDHFVRQDGTWVVLRRRVVDDWSRLDEVVATAREIGPDNHLGARDKSDPSYGIHGFVDARKRDS